MHAVVVEVTGRRSRLSETEPSVSAPFGMSNDDPYMWSEWAELLQQNKLLAEAKEIKFLLLAFILQEYPTCNINSNSVLEFDGFLVNLTLEFPF